MMRLFLLSVVLLAINADPIPTTSMSITDGVDNRSVLYYDDETSTTTQLPPEQTDDDFPNWGIHPIVLIFTILFSVCGLLICSMVFCPCNGGKEIVIDIA